MRVIASQKLPRDSGVSIFAARHQSVSQGPLGRFAQFSGRPRFGSVTVWGWNGSSGSDFRFRRFLFRKGFSVFQHSLAGKDGSGFGSWKNGSGGSGSAFGFGKNGSDGSGFRFRFGSWATLNFQEWKN